MVTMHMYVTGANWRHGVIPAETDVWQSEIRPVRVCTLDRQ